MHLGQNIADAAGFEHVADARPRFDAGAWAGRHEDHFAAAVLADDAMRNGRVAHLYLLLAPHSTRCILDGFFDRRRNFVGLAIAIGDTSLLIADDHQGVEAKTTAAFDH